MNIIRKWWGTPPSVHLYVPKVMNPRVQTEPQKRRAHKAGEPMRCSTCGWSADWDDKWKAGRVAWGCVFWEHDSERGQQALQAFRWGKRWAYADAATGGFFWVTRQEMACLGRLLDDTTDAYAWWGPNTGRPVTTPSVVARMKARS